MIALPERLMLKLVIGIVAALMLAFLIHDRNRWKATAALRHEQLVAEKNAHSGTIANYRAAAEQARRQDAANATRVKAEQAAINERTADDYESRIASARASYERLLGQSQGPAADRGGGGAAPVPGLSASSGTASESAGEDRLSDSDRLTATEQAIQLDELIKWVRRQHAVRPNGE